PPSGRRGVGPQRVADHGRRADGVLVVQHPELRRAIEERQLAHRRAQVSVLDEAADTGLFEQVLQVGRVVQRGAAPHPFHRESRRTPHARNALRNAAGSWPRSSTSTSAAPTTAPSACLPISLTCSARRTPKPAHTGNADAAFTVARYRAVSGDNVDSAPVMPVRVTA